MHCSITKIRRLCSKEKTIHTTGASLQLAPIIGDALNSVEILQQSISRLLTVLALCYLALLCLPTLANPSAKQVTITVETDIYHYAQQLLGDKSPLDIDDFSGANSQRDVVEFILVQKALTLGGADIVFDFELGNYDARNLKLLASGLLLISFDSMWLSSAQQIPDKVFISDPIIRRGEYFAGIYTADARDKPNIANLDDFKQLSIVSNKHWHVDWQTLNDIDPVRLVHEDEWITMAKLVSLGWVDAMLAPFTNNKPFSYQGSSYHISAVEGVKIALNDSRHFLISKQHPLGEYTFNALQKGLKIMRANGPIEKAYRQAGFLNEHVEHWPILNQDLVLPEPTLPSETNIKAKPF